MSHFKRNHYFFGLIVLLIAVSVIFVNKIYLSLTNSLIEERDEQLFNLEAAIDNNLKHEWNEVRQDLEEIIYYREYETIEQEYLATGDLTQMRELFCEDVLEVRNKIVAVVLEKDGDYYAFRDKYNEMEVTFMPDSNSDGIKVCYDSDGIYYVSVILESRFSSIRYYALMSLGNFYSDIVPESLRKENWIVFADFTSGLTLQNHDNQAAYMVQTKEEYQARQDGYTLLLESEMQNQHTATTYQYANYEERVVKERIICVPAKETINGFFSIAISRDSEALYERIDSTRQYMILIGAVLLLICSTLITIFLNYYHKEIELKRETAYLVKENELIRELTEARIQNSASQMQPHFMYNVLSSIRELILEDPEYAADMLYDFTWYLRACIRSLSGHAMIPFADEIRNIQSYVNIEKMRIGSGLQVVYDFVDTEYQIPALSIQPLVENAIRHGIAKKRGKRGTVSVQSYLEEQNHVIEVRDDGTGFDYQKICEEIEAGQRDSTGLQNVILRLEKSVNATVTVESKIGVGTKIVVKVPKEG